MSDISKAYEPQKVEDKWYSQWVENGCFKPSSDPTKEAYSIAMPPPNVTGVLTMGHVLNNTIQDILIRNARQNGKSAVWVPGTDHAGVATQTKVEAYLRKEGLSAKKLGREKFLEVAKQWRDKHGGIIIEQLKKLGASCDWSRLVHTLDDDYSKGVIKAFVELYKQGYIYRGKRMVNWCPVNLTALSDEEVIMTPQKSKIYKMKYQLADKSGYLEICTTRPETIMGDSAVAVNPNDPRYAHLVGKKCIRPFPEKEIPIIGDEAVDIKFGTGVLKVTPAHDPADFEIGKRHNLEVITVMNPDATMNELAGEDFVGLDRFKAREKAVEKLDKMGLLIEVKDYENNVGFSERGGVPIEPRVSDQWFMRYPHVKEAKEVVEKGLIKFWPARWEKTYLHWLDNIRDWCISRQIWWGHRIPVWYKKGVANIDFNNPEHVYVGETAPADSENWVQDEDSLDTWASSWLWPFGILGWPNRENSEKLGLARYYPTSTLVTGPDIIFFWVARMIMAGLEFTEGEEKDRIPFKNVYFTGIIRDMQGRKMSKSLGNSPDPLDLIAKYGADGLRFGIMNCAPQGQDILFSEDRVQLGRNFCNKLWNACRFRQMQGELGKNSSIDEIVSRIDTSIIDDNDKALILSLLNTAESIRKDYSAYQFNAITQDIYSFFWNDFCDWYLEVSKSRMADENAKKTILAIQDLCIRQTLLMLHPFTPFITEELWHSMGFGKDGEYIQNVYPYLDAEKFKAALKLNASALENVEMLKDFVAQARALKSQYKLATNKHVNMSYIAKDFSKQLLAANNEQLKKLIGLDTLSEISGEIQSPVSVAKAATIYLILSQEASAQDKAKLEKEKEKIVSLIASTKARLSNEAFVSKAPANVIEGAKKQLAQYESKLAELEKILG